ncbi:MAG TPA: hypothetical protein VKA35_06675 [Solirubrobacterales bacterium]|nr:hypothetical protein [Solirubrobacterales bacterium]
MTTGIASMTTSESAPRDGAQGASADFDEEVRNAEAAIREHLQANPGATWTLRELREAMTGSRTSSVMTTAFFNLEDRGELVVDYIASTVTAGA